MAGRPRAVGWAAVVLGVTIASCAADGAAARGRHGARTLEQEAAASRVVALSRCYGRFIAWRDELQALMQASGSYTPSPDAPSRFDRVESSFIDSAQSDRRLTLRLRPTFAEKDFPRDLRRAFRAGLKETKAVFASDDYLTRRKAVAQQPDLSPIPRMAAFEDNADAGFKPLGEPCDQLAAANP